MTSDFAILITGLIGTFGLGWAAGKTIKAIRQFFESV
jgi:hypothetical protein